jgi:hypothetical protein
MAFFDGSTGYLLNSSSPITALPFTVALWAYWDGATGDRVAWSLGPSTNSTAVFEIAKDNAGTWSFYASTAVTGGFTATANAWTFLLARAIGASNRRFSVLQPDGSISHSQSTTNISITMARMSLGRLMDDTTPQYWSGGIAEFWYTNNDVVGTNLATNNDFLRQLAFRGPFSIRNVAANIVEYRSLRSHIGSESDVFGDLWWGRSGRQTWALNGTVTQGQHPPAANNYVTPADFQQIVPV